MALDLSSFTQEQKDALLVSLLGSQGPQEKRSPGVPPPEGPRAFGEAPKPNPPTVQRLPTPEQWVTKQMRTLASVGEANYREGITRPKKDPIKAGIEAQARYETEMRKPEVLKRREENLKRTNMDEWAVLAEGLGAGRLVQGVEARKFKVERAVSARHRVASELVRKIDAMPDVTDADRERRMVENLRILKASKGAK